MLRVRRKLLAIHHLDRLCKPPESAIKNFCFRWEVDLDEELRGKMSETFERMRADEEEEFSADSPRERT